MFLKELMLIKEVNQESMTSVTIQSHVCNRCQDLLIKSMNLSNIAILKIKNVNYQCIITEISKSEAIKLLENIDLTEKKKKKKRKIINIKNNFKL